MNKICQIIAISLITIAAHRQELKAAEGAEATITAEAAEATITAEAATALMNQLCTHSSNKELNWIENRLHLMSYRHGFEIITEAQNMVKNYTKFPVNHITDIQILKMKVVDSLNLLNTLDNNWKINDLEAMERSLKKISSNSNFDQSKVDDLQKEIDKFKQIFNSKEIQQLKSDLETINNNYESVITTIISFNNDIENLDED